MPDSRPEELMTARQFMREGKLDKALGIIKNYEKSETITPENQLSALLMKGTICVYKNQYKKVVEIGEMVYQISQKLGNVSQSIDGLIFKSYMVFIDKIEDSLDSILEAERLINSFTNESSSYLTRQKTGLLALKSWNYYFRGDLNRALKLVTQCLEINKKFNNKVAIAQNFTLFSYTFMEMSKFDVALDYTMKSLKIYEELNNDSDIAIGLSQMGLIYTSKGDFDQAFKFCKQSLLLKGSSTMNRINTINTIGSIYMQRGELDRSLRCFDRARVLAEEINSSRHIRLSISNIGQIHRLKGNYDKAIEYLEHSVLLSEKTGNPLSVYNSLFLLIKAYLNINNLEQAQHRLTRLKELADQSDYKLITQFYILAKAYLLRTSARRRDRAEAEILFKKIVEDDTIHNLHVQSIINLCDLLLEELSIYNNPEVLNEIKPLITKLIKVTVGQRSHMMLPDIKLIQAKIALIQMNIEEARQLLTEGQRFAELHGLSKWVTILSGEHDTLLEQLDSWENLKKKDAPMADRIKLASFDGVFARLQENRAIELPELVDEQPTLLLIIAEGGILLFSHTFAEEFPFEEDLLSGFLTAFSTFSNELFSRGLDRAKFGEDTILIDSVGLFSVCYLFKGQTYPAMQKLAQFMEKIKNSTPILQTFDEFYKTSQILELKDIPSLESLINEIFIEKNVSLT